MNTLSRAIAAWLVLAIALTPMASTAALADAGEIRVSRGYSVLYLPQMVMQKKN